MFTDHRKSCQECGEFIPVTAHICRFCKTKQETFEYPLLEMATYWLAHMFWMMISMSIPFTVAGLLIGDMNIIERARSNFEMTITFTFFYFFVYVIITTVPKISSFFSSRATDDEIRVIKNNRKSLRKIKIIFPLIGVLISFILIGMKKNRPTEEAFLKFLDKNTSYIEDEILLHRENTFLSLYHVATEESYISYLGIWNSFIQVPNSEFWYEITEKKSKYVKQ